MGVNFDTNLNFNHHVDLVCQKANQTLSFLCRNLKQSNRKLKLDAYKIYVKPILNYAATVWSPHTTCSIKKLESIQKRAACFIVKDYRRTSSITQILISSSLKSISYLHTKMWLLMFYKIVYKLVELPLSDNIYYSFRSTRGNEFKFICHWFLQI